MKKNNECTKTFFISESKAQTRANDINRSRGDNDTLRFLYVYKCPYCSGWHLTKNYNKVSTDQELINELTKEIKILKGRIERLQQFNDNYNLVKKQKDIFLTSFLARHGLLEEFEKTYNAFNEL